ncbi:hypothetical protein ACF0H5_020501 [Mactra antiquata]
MENYLQLACLFYFLTIEVSAFPTDNSKLSTYSDVNLLCKTFAMRQLLQDDTFSNVKDFPLRMRTDTDLSKYGGDLSAELSNQVYSLENSVANEKGFEDVAERIERMREDCMTLYASAKQRADMKTKKDAENLEVIESENFTDGGLKELLGRTGLNESPKRNSDLGLNPTGWRKRRSGRNRDDEEMEEFLQNMRQILKKRERLQFNPTGW